MRKKPGSTTELLEPAGAIGSSRGGGSGRGGGGTDSSSGNGGGTHSAGLDSSGNVVLGLV